MRPEIRSGYYLVLPDDGSVRILSPWNAMKPRRVDHGPAVSLAAIAILIVVSAAALKYLGS
jgi:hypothetical protein